MEGFGEALPPQIFPSSRSIGGFAADRARKKSSLEGECPPNLPSERRLRKYVSYMLLPSCSTGEFLALNLSITRAASFNRAFVL
jgi:hypothetical protein